MIPNFIPLIEPLRDRFPSAWAKCKAPHDDGEFNARVCAVLYHEHGMTRVGRNGKRGDPNNLSKDIINWRGTEDEPGQNPDPQGGTGTITDFIVAHESKDASIGQFYPDPNGPGAWVRPLTLAQIDGGGAPPVAQYPKYEDLGGDAGAVKITERLERDYKRAGRPGLDGGCGVWVRRVDYDFLTGKCKTVEESIEKHAHEWCDALGIPVT